MDKEMPETSDENWDLLQQEMTKGSDEILYTL